MTHTNKYYINLKVKNLKNSEVEIEAEIPTPMIEKHREHILEELRKDFEAPGFRKGHVPMNVFLRNVNEMHVLSEAAELALNDAYPEIVKDEKIEVFGKPQITLTKLVPKNPVGFKIRVGTIPEISLPDYKKIAKKITDEADEPITVSAEEIHNIIKQIKGMSHKHEEGVEHSHDFDTELTDDFVKTLGAFKDVDDFKAKIKENIQKDKENALWQKKRERIISKLIENAKMTLPAIVVEDEANSIRERFHENLKTKNMSKEEYLKKIGKTEEDLKKEDLAHIEKELKLRLILDKMAELENIEVPEEEVEREMEYMTVRHPDADPANLRNYIESILKNEKLLRLIEGRLENKV